MCTAADSRFLASPMGIDPIECDVDSAGFRSRVGKRVGFDVLQLIETGN